MAQKKDNAPTSYSPGRIALAAGLAALAIRLVYLYVARHNGLFVGLFLDSRYYAEVAARLRGGFGAGDHPYLMSPFYPYLLAVFTNAAGELNATAVRIFQAVCDAGTAACVSLVAGRIGGRSAAVLAGAAAALYAPMIYFTGIILVATVQTLFLTIALVMLLHADDQPEQRNLLWTVAGVTLGFAAVLRPTILAVVLAVVAVEAVLAWRDRDRRRVRWRAATLLLAGAALMIAPFTLRNVTRGGEPVLLSANGGFNFFIGNNARATGVFHLPDAVDPFHDVLGKSFAERAAGRAMTYREAGAWWRARAMADIRENPVRWIGLMAKKAALFFHPVEIPQLGASFEWHRRHAWPLRFPLDARTVLILALLCPLAVAASAGRKPFSPLLWPAAISAAYIAAVVPFFVNARYRLPIMPIALALAAVTMTAVAHRLWRGVREERRRAWATVAAFAAVWMVSHAVFRGPLAVQTGTASEERHRGMALYRDGRFEEAVAAYRRSLGEKESSITRNNLANALKQLGRFDEARAEYENALRLNPQSAVAWYNVGNFRFEVEKDADGAREAYEHATRFAPEMAAAQYKLGTVLASLGRSADARWAFERCVAAAKPDDPLIPLARRALQQLP